MPDLRVIGSGPPEPPPDRGRLMTPDEVADLIGDVSPEWVRRNVPHKLDLGHNTKRWWEYDVRDWLEELR